MSLLEQGTRLGPYVLLGLLGEGGMGKVYRARDVRLDREVAVKVLKPPFCEDPEWLARFEREARLLASFSHPAIATVHGLDDADGVRYLALELVPGESLADRLRRGPLPPAEALDVARQISEALEAAHERGVIHRDLKPGNVMLTPEGKVKVLDFGLARQASPVASSSVKSMETAALDPVTVEGSLVGTPAYVAPEQARGQRLDRRCDVWALGCVLFEILSGEKAFSGETLTDVLAAVLHDEPQYDALPRDLPPRVEALIRRCLRKELRRRLCDAGDARVELEEAIQELHSGPPVTAVKRPRRPWLSAALVALALAAGVGLGVLAAGKKASPRRDPPDPPEPIALPEWTGEQLLDGTTIAFGPRVSPDGKWLAYGTFVEGQTQVAVMNLETADRFTRTKDVTRGMLNSLSWSPDNRRIYFDRYFNAPAGIFTTTPPGVEQDGGDEVPFADERDNAECPQATHDGRVLYCKPHGPGRSRFYLRAPGGEESLVLPEKVEVELTTGWPPAAVRALHGKPAAVFCGKLFDGSTASPERFLYLLDLTGKDPPRKLPVEAFQNDLVALAVSHDDEYVYTVLPAEDLHRLVRIPLSGPVAGKPQTLWLMTHAVFGLDVDKAGRVYAVQFPQPREILRFTTEGGQPQRLAFLSRGRDMEAVRLADGRLLLPSRAEGRDRLLLKRPDGKLAPLLADGGETRHPAALNAAGRLAFVAGPAKKPALKVATITPTNVGHLNTLGHVPADGLTSLAWSPDGERLYYVRKKELFWTAVKGGEPRSLGAADGFAVHPSEGKLLVQRFEADGVTLVWVDVSSGKRTPVPLAKGPLRLIPYPLGTRAIDAEGKTALVNVGSSDKWFWQTAILDLKTGAMTPLKASLNYDGDVSPANWSGEGKGEVLAVGYPLRSELWRLTPR